MRLTFVGLNHTGCVPRVQARLAGDFCQRALRRAQEVQVVKAYFAGVGIPRGVLGGTLAVSEKG